MIEIRLNNGFLEYRYRVPMITTSIRAYPPEEWGWSEWKEVTENGKRFQVAIIREAE